jgi:hypothetical protein
MARARLVDPSEDLLSDGGAILFSFVQGEQLEFPVELDFISDISAGYTYEAVVVEANNTAAQTVPPEIIKAAGVQTTLTVRIPTYTGVWATGSYDLGEIAKDADGQYYKSLSETFTSTVTPAADGTNWAVTNLKTVYVQFPLALGSTWAQSPIVNVPVYGFFELQVNEPSNTILDRIWKPIRGVVEILFSPTEIVA